MKKLKFYKFSNYSVRLYEMEEIPKTYSVVIWNRRLLIYLKNFKTLEDAENHYKYLCDENNRHIANQSDEIISKVLQSLKEK